MTTNTNPINSPAAPRTVSAGASSYPPGPANPEPISPGTAAPDLAANKKADAGEARAALASMAGSERKQPQPITAEEVEQAIVQNPGPAFGAAVGIGFLLGFLLKKMLPAKTARRA